MRLFCKTILPSPSYNLGLSGSAPQIVGQIRPANLKGARNKVRHPGQPGSIIRELQAGLAQTDLG